LAQGKFDFTSAPEIMLSVIETLQTLGSVPGELGPSTIVGSAAFNLLIISAVSIMAVELGQLKKVDDVGVFFITSLWSVFAYVWMYIVLQVWTPEIVTIHE
jgi:Ca2+/Na+ antiporter